MTVATLESLLAEAAARGLVLHGFSQHLDSRPNDSKIFGHELIREWNVRLKCTNGHYATGTGDTPSAALQAGLDDAKRVEAWRPQPAPAKPSRPTTPTLDDLESLA